MQTVAQRLFLLRALAGLALDCLELAVELLAHLGRIDRRAAEPAVEGNLGAADMRHLGTASDHLQHVAHAPQAEADDQHAEEDEQNDVTGVLAELIHGPNGGS